MKVFLNKRAVQKAGVLASLLTVTLLIGHGCSEFAANSGGSGGGSSSMGSTGGAGAGSGFTPFPNATTVSLIYNKQMLDNLVICTGIGTASVSSVDEWERRQSSFSEYGYATDVTAPMLMAIAAVSGEVCNDLLNIETALSSDSRRIFNSIDFAAGPSALGASQIADATRRLARSCWARDEMPEELTIVQEEVNAATAGLSVNDAQQTRNLALMMCTGILASLSGISL